METLKSGFVLDDWQKKVLATKGNICLRSGRQVGKSTIISIKAAKFAAENENKSILVIAAVERQAYYLFEKILAYLSDNHRNLIKKGKDRPTKSHIKLKNGSIIRCLPTGLSGFGIRGYTVDLLIADEAHFIPEDVWIAVTPMLATTWGDVWLLSTPHGSQGYYYECFFDKNFTQFHVSSEDCPRIDKDWLAREKKRMTSVQYAQEYLGDFMKELKQFFPAELIKKCMTVKRGGAVPYGDKFMGVDVAGMGGDETVLVGLNRKKEKLRQFYMDVRTKTRLTDTVTRILDNDKKYNYKKIYIDDGGLGVGVFDPLLAEEQTRRKVEAINNSSRSLEYDSTRTKRLLKEDLYSNLKNLMEKGEIEIFAEPEIRLSLESIQIEETEDKRIRIYGNYSHITEALIRAAWSAKNKSLNIYLY